MNSLRHLGISSTPWFKTRTRVDTEWRLVRGVVGGRGEGREKKVGGMKKGVGGGRRRRRGENRGRRRRKGAWGR